ncbi:uncharacterized protein C8Q71DRAFT_728929 [Rhodofomes roseus]|uniref:Uncharacterized protein n=1 Tax=Rhodofomes roseus TaxID=34475 RepID=A0ABQ8KWX7_9APHY|nr:uncharacterized protein C8Q71DRAFT_728929 [Rhodofomes roseus]KAH9843553.1 hypothetical protein C8Q71DRAFT_728929 [Rhodofomes roseus]
MHLADIDTPRALQSIASLQDVEIHRLRGECNAFETEIRNLREQLNERVEAQTLVNDLRDLVEKVRDAEHNRELRESVNRLNDQLHSQLNEKQQRLVELEASNDALKTTRARLEETLIRDKARFEEKFKQACAHLGERDDDICFLERKLSEMGERAKLAEREQQWTEQQLASCSRYVQELLGEIADVTQKAQQSLGEKASSAFLRGSRLNKWVTQRTLQITQENLEAVKSREVSLLIEIAELRRQAEQRALPGESSQIPCIGNVIVCADEPPRDSVFRTQSTVRQNDDDPRLYMTPGGVLEDMFRALSSKAPDPQAIKEILGIKNIVIVTPADFVWASCPDTGHFVKAALFRTKGDKWQDTKLKFIKRLQKRGPTEIIPYFSGAYYYVGTYTVGEAEAMNAVDFEGLPEKTQQEVISSSGKPTEWGSLRELYLCGKLSALRFPVQRTGFNSPLHQYLRQNA